MRPNNGGNNNFNRRPNRNNHSGGGNYNNRNSGGNSAGNNMRRTQQPQNLRSQVFDSHGPNGERVRGNAFQVHEKYQSLARDAEERVDQEAYGQFAEHYYRIIEAIQELEAERNARFAPQQGQNQNQQYQSQQPTYAEQPGTPQNASGFGEQPDLNPGEPGNGSQDGRVMRNEQNREQGREQGRDQGRNQNRRGYRDQNGEQAREPRQQRSEHQQMQRSDDGQQPAASQEWNRDEVQQQMPPRERHRRPLEPINQNEGTDSPDSGPIFSIADRTDSKADPDNVPDTAVADEAPKRRRGRPAKIKPETGDDA